ncbi:TonB-dependent siderophore receptor [compost metagenome]
MKYVDDRNGQTEAVTYNMDQYTVVDLLTFYKVNEHVRLNLDVKNVFNKGYDEGAFNSYVYPGAPRTVQAGVSYTF